MDFGASFSRDTGPRGRRWRRVTLDPALIVDLLRGGVFQVRGCLPDDSDLRGWLIDTDTLSLVLAVHSNSHELVAIGDLIPEVGPIEIVDLSPPEAKRPRRRDLLFRADVDIGFAGVVGWTCSDCRETIGEPPALIVPAGLEARYCESCA